MVKCYRCGKNISRYFRYEMYWIQLFSETKCFSRIARNPCFVGFMYDVREREKKITFTNLHIQLDSEDIHCGDVLVLLLMCDVHHPSNSKAALSVLHTKMKRSFISEQLLDQVFKLAHTSFAAHAKCLLKIAQGMVSTSS